MLIANEIIIEVNSTTTICRASHHAPYRTRANCLAVVDSDLYRCFLLITWVSENNKVERRNWK